MNLRKIAFTLVAVSSLVVAQSAMAQSQAVVVGGSAAGVTAGTIATATTGVLVTATVVAGSMVWLAAKSNSGTTGTVKP